MKKLLLAVILIMGAYSAISFAACVGPYCWDDRGSSVQGLGGYITQPIFGDNTGNAVSTATTSTDRGVYIPVYISTAGTALVRGDTVITTTAFASQGVAGTISNTGGATNLLGVVSNSCSTGTVCNVMIDGVALALTTGTVNVGDLLVTTTAANGYLATNNAATNSVMGRALASGNSAGGLTKIAVEP
jgi:hypothetical protein